MFSEKGWTRIFWLADWLAVHRLWQMMVFLALEPKREREEHERDTR